jgi:D-alanyl-D-alanine carboxypeptidase
MGGQDMRRRDALSGLAAAGLLPAVVDATEVEAAAWAAVDLRAIETPRGVQLDRTWPPASLTKLALAVLAAETVRAGRLAWTDTIAVSAPAAAASGARLGLQVNERLEVYDALAAMLVGSCNDAARTLAEAVAGHEAACAVSMTRLAGRHGAIATRFADATGISAASVTTARDLARLAGAFEREAPEVRLLAARREIVAAGRTVRSTNGLLGQAGIDGLKTGSSSAAGLNLIASAPRGRGRRLAIVLGASDRATRNGLALDLLAGRQPG